MNLTDRNPVPELPIHVERARLRKLFGITKTELAKELHVGRRVIYAWERGDYEPTGENRVRYAELLNSWARTDKQARTLVNDEIDQIEKKGS